jgi:hypothetical protein
MPLGKKKRKGSIKRAVGEKLSEIVKREHEARSPADRRNFSAIMWELEDRVKEDKKKAEEESRRAYEAMKAKRKKQESKKK